MASEQFSLVLGCGGNTHHDIMLCSGTYNVIVNFDRHFEAEQLKKTMDFLDFACGLFDKPMGDWNKIVNTLKMLREQHHLLDDKMWEALHLWLPQHKRCGAFLRLMFNADIESTFKPTPQEAPVGPDFMECPVMPVTESVPVAQKKPRKKRGEKKVFKAIKPKLP